jgi:hypothetical protein
MTMHINLRLTALFAAAALSGPAAVAVAQTVSGPDTPRFDVPQASTDPVPATAAAKAAFSVLARAASTDDADNTLVARIAAQSEIGIDAAGSRVVGSVASGRVWLMPANGALCLGLEDTAGDSIGIACTLEDAALDDGVTIGDGTQVLGLAPDAVTAIHATPADAPQKSAATSGGGSLGHGGEVYTLDSGHNTVTLDAPDGSRSFDANGGGAHGG